MFNYVALIFVAVAVMVVTDDDPTTVSLQEWALFAVMAYAAYGFFRAYVEYEKRRR